MRNKRKIEQVMGELIIIELLALASVKSPFKGASFVEGEMGVKNGRGIIYMTVNSLEDN
ncbi:hypothetical protein WHY20_06825 [Clostridium perfringens]|uniref:hypothetical protein n=1 Tax=Clostridium perfringens TaxID=1502 RepID=UPI001CAF56E5|nr:hypothetical protein [Clostridium perfringens]HBI6994893.1 hypothetical protein [Clostridium perfringens]HBI7378534.1 hypothetical protein [Clostridium perfringens]